MYSENVDEDEFGLPSISNIRHEAKRIPRSRAHDPGGGPSNGNSLLGTGPPQTRERANSSDIAEERGPPDYPAAKKSEGKILRPQYKDILRGWLPSARQFLHQTKKITLRPCQFATSDCSPFCAIKRHAEGV